VNGVDMLETNMPFPLLDRQVGIFAQSRKDIRFRNFTVISQRPRVFVAMQFDVPEYDALYRDVIVPVCNGMDLEDYRADETYSPGLVVADIARQIRESRIVIAEVSSVNPNVFYEVGYADAIDKPVILVADRKGRDLPFDVRPYRTLFYENSIGGKKTVETVLTKYLQTILSQKSASIA